MQSGRSPDLPPAAAREEGVALAGLVLLVVVTSAWWALALWPVQDGPAWLERTRSACFGVAESGLPDTGGWIGLIAGPLGMLAILLTGWARGFRALLLRARRSRPVLATLLTLLAATALLVSGAGLRVHQVRAAALPLEEEGGLPPASYPRLDQPAPALALVSQHGDVVDLESFRGRPVLVTFAYAHCTTVCPVIVQQALAAQAARTDAGARPVVLVVTLDPWRDPPSRLPGMARSWGVPDADAYVLSGDTADVARVLDEWQVPRLRNEVTGDITHPALLYIVDRDGRIAFASNGGTEAITTLLGRLD